MHLLSRACSLACAAICSRGCWRRAAAATRSTAAAHERRFSAERRRWSSCPRVVGRRQDDAHRIVDRAGLKLRWLGFAGKLGNGRYNISCVKVLSQSPGRRRAPAARREHRRHRGRLPHADQAPYSVFHAGAEAMTESPRGL